MSTKRLFVSLFFLMTCFFCVWAGTVKGKLVGPERKPLDFVNVVLKPLTSNGHVYGAISTASGDFSVQDVPIGTYEVEISFVGLKTYTDSVKIIKASSVVDMGVIRMREDATELAAVEITGQASQMRFDIDKKVFNVDQNLAGAGASASEMLSNIPSVDVDNEGNISLRNNSSVEVWINGKPSGLDADNRAQILEQMPAGSIESVEVITNPSAKYNPEGTAGIINLVLKKDRKAGYYGNVQAGVNYPWGTKNPGGNLSANINYNSSKLDAFANVGARYMAMNGSGYTNRYTFAPQTNRMDTLSRLYQKSTDDRQFGGIFTRAGLDWHITKKQSLGLTFTGFFGADNSESTINYTVDQFLTQSRQLYTRDNTGNGNHNSYSATLDYLYELDNKGSDWRTSLSYYGHDNKNKYTYEQKVQSGNMAEYFQKQRLNGQFNTLEFKSDLVKKFGDNMKMETGVFGSYNNRFSPTRAYDVIYQSIDSLVQYNDFHYQEYIAALYATYGAKFGNFSFQAGLRGEFTHTLVETRDASDASYKDTPRSYFELFPTTYLSYSLPGSNELQLNYTRRINRPRGRQLNSFRDLSDSTNIVFGNPYLKPEFASALELNYIKSWTEHVLSASLYYRYMDDVIQSVYFIDANHVMNQTYDNIAKQQSAGLELVSKNRLARWLNLTTTVNLYYAQIDAVYYDTNMDGTLNLLSPASSDFSWSARLMANFMFGKGFSGQVTGKYRSPRVIAQGETKAEYSIDFGLRKSFLDRKLNLNLSARGLLQARGRRTITYGDTFWQDSERQRSGAMLSLSLSYNFGNMKQKGKKEKENMMQSDFGDDELDM